MGKSASWRQKRVLVTGATGFIGRSLTRRLKELDAQVYPTTSPTWTEAAGAPSSRRQLDTQVYPTTSPTDESDPPSPPPGGTRGGEKSPPGGTRGGEKSPLTFDIRNVEAVRSALGDVAPDVVFHLAAVGVTNPDVDPMLALRVNVGGVVNLLKALRESKGNNVERVVLVGTSYEYGASPPAGGIRGGESPRKLDPFNAYAASKVAAWAFGQMYWRAYELPVVTVRPFQVYGPGQPGHTLIPAAVRAAMSGEDFPMTPGEQERDFIFAEDVADGMIAAAERAGIEGTSLDLGTGSGIPVLRVVEQIWELADAKGNIQPGAHAYRTGAAMHLVADADRTAQLIGWRATTPLEEGLRITMKQTWSKMEQAI